MIPMKWFFWSLIWLVNPKTFGSSRPQRNNSQISQPSNMDLGPDHPMPARNVFERPSTRPVVDEARAAELLVRTAPEMP